MHHHRRLVRILTLLCAALLAGLSALQSAPPVSAAPAAQIAPGGRYVPRPVTIRRLPGGRVLRIVSRSYGGVSNRVCTLAALDEQGFGVRTPGMGDAALLAPVIFLPGSGQLADALNAPVLCVLAGDAPVTAVASAPDGTTLPALVIPEGRLSIVSVPIDAFTMPGEWQLEVTAPVSGTYTFTIPPITQPTLVVSGDALLLTGYQPGEALRGVVMANHCTTTVVPLSDPPEPLPPLDAAELELCAQNEVSALLDAVQSFDVVADARGVALLERIDPQLDLTYVFFGAETPQLLSSALFSEDLDTAIAEGGFPVDRATLFVENNPEEVDPQIDELTPTPAVLPATGASHTADGHSVIWAALLVVLTGIAVLAGARRGAYRRR